jgi:hypothetical protein
VSATPFSTNAGAGGRSARRHRTGLLLRRRITSWASQTGCLLPATAPPQLGDLMLFGDRHVRIVDSVNPDGTITTIDGNSENAVRQVTRQPGEATGFVRLG